MEGEEAPLALVGMRNRQEATVSYPTPAEDEFQFVLGRPVTPGSQWQWAALAGEGRVTGVGLTEELQEAALTVGLVILLLEGALVELLEAKGAHEMLGVELLGHGGDAAAGDGLLAAGAQ